MWVISTTAFSQKNTYFSAWSLCVPPELARVARSCLTLDRTSAEPLAIFFDLPGAWIVLIN